MKTNGISSGHVRSRTLSAGVMGLIVLGLGSSFNRAFGNPPLSKAELNKALFEAASHDRIADIKSLITQGADVNFKGNEGLTPFMEVAVDHGDLPAMKLMLKAGANINAFDVRGMTALSNAAFLGRILAVKELLGLGAKVDIRDKEGKTPLILAADSWDDVAALLIAHGANVNATDREGTTAAYQTVTFPESTHGPGAKFSSQRLHCLKILIAHGAKLNVKAKHGYTTLISASYWGSADVVQLLIQNHADLNIRNDQGRTALDMAIKANHPDVVKLLRDAGAKE